MHVALRAKLLALAGTLVARGDAYGPPSIGEGRGAGGVRGGGERKRNGARELLEGDDVSSVVKEAFDENGTSLGYSHDAASNWSHSVILSEGITPGDVPFMYHANASY